MRNRSSPRISMMSAIWLKIALIAAFAMNPIIRTCRAQRNHFPRSSVPGEVVDQPKDECQEDRKDNATGQGEVEAPVAAAKCEIARQTEQADPAAQHHEGADHHD